VDRRTIVAPLSQLRRETICGICGTAPGGDLATLEAMSGAMVHRGPDDAGVFLAPGAVGLAARRLSVIDPEHGHQPLANEDETIWAVLNGEIYNFPLLRRRLLSAGHSFATNSDTEVLAHLYEERSVELVHDLEGMYAFAIWDSRNRRLLLVRDRFGEKPLFYTERQGVLTFASEVTALLAGIKGRKELDARAVDAYFTYGYVPGDTCIVTGIRQLEPGHLLLWDAERRAPQIRPYWTPTPFRAAERRPIEDLVDQTEELLERAVRSRLIADVPLGVFLSGGVDSALVAAFATRHAVGTLKTFTVDYDVGAVGERVAARKAATAIGADHQELTLGNSQVQESAPRYLGELDQPLADPAFIALRALSEFARREVTVAVGGEGADELFGGYPRYRWIARAASLPAWIPRQTTGAAFREFGRVSGYKPASRLAQVLSHRSTLERHVDWVTSNRRDLRGNLYGTRMRQLLATSGDLETPCGVNLESGDVLGSLMRLDQLRWLPDDVLAKADRASMRASLELRTPFLSADLANFAASVPPGIHVREGGKLLLRHVLRRTLPTLPPTRKIAFRTPCAEWLRGPLRSTLQGQLDDNSLYLDGWFEPKTVASWIRTHNAGRADMTHALWPVFALGCGLTRTSHAAVEFGASLREACAANEVAPRRTYSEGPF
jgi:asparagine synthase (glutamine-hydrolysing)